MVSKKTKLRIRRVPSSRERLQPVMVSKKKARSRTLLSSRERDNPIVDLIFTWWHNYTSFHLGREAVVQSLNDPSIDLSGIYIGNGKVIHFTQGGGKDRIIFSSSPSHPSNNTCAMNSDQSRLDRVVTTSIDDFLLGGKLYRFEYSVNLALFIAKIRGGTCTRAPSAPLEIVKRRLSYHLKNGFGDYHLFKNNCEDFAIYCKTGFKVADYNFSIGRSGQAASFVVAISTFICSIMRSPAVRITVLHFVIGYGIYSACRLASDIRVGHSVGEAADERLAEEESYGNFRYPSSVKFNSAFLIPKRLVCHLLLVAV